MKKGTKPMRRSAVVTSVSVTVGTVQDLVQAGLFEEFWEALGKAVRLKQQAANAPVRARVEAGGAE